MSGGRLFRCSCCGRDFRTDKPQDPDRDDGFGTCPKCRDWIKDRWPGEVRRPEFA